MAKAVRRWIGKQINNFIKYCNINQMQFKIKMMLMAISSLVIASFSFYQLYKRKKAKEEAIIDEQYNQQRQLYINQIQDPIQFRLKNVNLAATIAANIHYSIILSLNKGSHYEGIITIQFEVSCTDKQLKIDYNGSNLCYVSINGHKIEQSQIRYVNHQIQIPKEHLKHKNKVEIIFSNKYSFLDDGLASFFKLGQNSKYSLKEQIIFTKNGPSEISRIIPCLNSLDECNVDLTILHPQNFEAYSNVPKSAIELCTIQDYPNYGFLFRSGKVNRSVNTSMFTNSQVNPQTIIKSMTKFYQIKLHSIHELFIFVSFIHEEESRITRVLIKYIYKKYMSQLASKFIMILEEQIQRLISIITSRNQHFYISKLDIFFINDKNADGYFSAGALILDEEWLTYQAIDENIIYLIARCLLCVGNNKRVPMSYKDISELNLLTFKYFQEVQQYLVIKQVEYKQIRYFGGHSEYMKDHEYFFTQYYQYQLRYIIKEDVSSNKTGLNKIVEDVNNCAGNARTYWKKLNQFKYQIRGICRNLLVKVSLRYKPLPLKIDREIHEECKKVWRDNVHYIDFLSDQEIQQNLEEFLKNEAEGLDKKLPKLRIPQKYRQYLIHNQHLKQYLPAKSNKQQTKSLYEQFKRFNEMKNFHHLTVLKSINTEDQNIYVIIVTQLIKINRMWINVLESTNISQIFPQDHILRKNIQKLSSIQQF